MSVRDARRPPFAWLALDALQSVRRDLPRTRQQGARNALLALAEAASRRRDGVHASGDTLVELAALAGLSDRRLREHLQELARIGLIRIEVARDGSGRDLPTTYVLLEPWSDETSDRGDATRDGRRDKSSDPTRAGLTPEEEEGEQEPPQPPASGGSLTAPVRPSGNRQRDRDRHARDVAAWLRELEAIAPHVEPARLNGLGHRWESIDAQLRTIGGYDLWLSTLHPHGEVDGRLIVATEQERVTWVADRYGSMLERLAGQAVSVIPCDRSAER